MWFLAPVRARYPFLEVRAYGFGSAGGNFRISNDRTNDRTDPQPTRVDGHPPLTLEHQLTGAPREARKASGGS